MQLDFTKGYDCNGTFRPKLLWANTTGQYPNAVHYSYGEDAPNLDNFDPATVQAIYPDSIIKQIISKSDYTKSCSEDEDETRDWEIDDIYIFTDKFYAEVDFKGIDLITNLSPDEAKEEIEKILSVLPDADNTPPLKEIKLICYDGEYYTISSAIKKVDIDIDKYYNDDFKPYYDKIVKFLDVDNKESGVVVLNGTAGSGKTSILRNIINTVNGNYIFINPTMASNLTDSALTSFLMAHKNSIFILEDCEQVIMDREDSSLASAVASLLNMSDGLMSDIFNGKFICTFNADISSIDKALLRKGRCKARYTFGKLSADKTKALLIEQGVSPEEAEKAGQLTLADIFNYGEDTGVKDQSLEIGF